MAKTESELTRELLTGCMVFSCVASRMQTSGWPDRYVSHPLWSGWLEFKAENGRLSALQREVLRRLRSHDAGQAFVARHETRTIEDEAGATLGRWDGTLLGPAGLLRELARLAFEARRHKTKAELTG